MSGSEPKPSPSLALPLGILLGSVLLLPTWLLLSNRYEHAVRSVVLTPAGCQVANHLAIPVTAVAGGCELTQPGMHLYADVLELSDGKQLARSVVLAWTK